jgi:4'-phosphopantetheinyl transferase
LDYNSSTSAVPLWASADRVTAPVGVNYADIWRIRFRQPHDQLEALSSVLSADERRRAARFAFSSDRDQYTVVHGALRILLGALMGQEPSTLAFDVSETGKPRLANMRDAPRFSLSHTRGMGLLAISREVEVGVDVEYQRPDFRCVEIAERFFSADESRYLRELAPDAQCSAFFAAWVRKEAWLKARGTGLGSLHLLNVGMGQCFQEGRLWSGDGGAAGFPAIWLQDLSVASGYPGAVALENSAGQFNPRLRYLDWQIGSQYH